MRQIMTAVAGTLLIALGVSGTALAQNVVQIQGTIQSVDCRANTLVLASGGVVNVVPVTAYTAVFVNAVPVVFCALQQYIGGYAVASVTPAGNQWIAGRIDVAVAIAPPPPPYYYPYPDGYYYPGYYGPPVGVGIGIVIGPGYRYHGRHW